MLLRLIAFTVTVAVGLVAWSALVTWLVVKMGQHGITMLGPVAWLTVLVAAMLLARFSAGLIRLAIRFKRKPRLPDPAREDWTDLTGE